MARRPSAARFRRIELLHLSPDWEWGGAQTHDWHELICVVRGHYRVETPGGRLQGTDGAVFYLPAGLAHRPTMRMGNDRRFFVLSWIETGAPFLGLGPRQAHDVSGRIRVLLNWLWETFPGGDPALADTLVRAVQHAVVGGGPADRTPTMQRVLQHMRASLEKKIRLDDLASVAGLSAWHFARRFHQETGQSPMKALAAMRVEAAQSLLRDTDLPLKAVAARVGVANEFHLSRLIRRQVGLPPRAWRQILRSPRTEPAQPLRRKKG